MNEVENEDLVFTLETIVDKFGEEMAPYALGLCQNLVSTNVISVFCPIFLNRLIFLTIVMVQCPLSVGPVLILWVRLDRLLHFGSA